MSLKLVAKAVLVVNSEVAETGSPSSDVFVFDLDGKFNDHSSAKNTVRRELAEVRDEKIFKEASDHCVQVR